MPLSVLLIGRPERGEFAPIRAEIKAARLQPEYVDIRRAPAQAPLADLWIVCQSWPDEFSPAEALDIVAACSTSRLICVYGAWCASDGRTRSVWPAAVRTPVAEFAARLQFELRVIAGHVPPLPLTAARDECFAARCRQ